MERIYYYPFNPYEMDKPIEDHPQILEAMYDLERVNFPHKAYKSYMNQCPAMNVYDDVTYIVRSPFDFHLEYDRETNEWNSDSSELANSLLIRLDDKKPYIQLAIFYLFWVQKKSDSQIWQHDIPLFMVNKIPTWYSVSGMLPVGRYTRNTSVGMVLKPDQNVISIERSQPLCSITFVGKSKIELVKQKPSHKIIQDNINNNQKKFICPYTFSKQLFSKWLN